MYFITFSLCFKLYKSSNKKFNQINHKVDNDFLEAPWPIFVKVKSASFSTYITVRGLKSQNLTLPQLDTVLLKTKIKECE